MIASFKKFFLDEAEIYSIIKFYFEIYSLYLYRILYIFLQANHCVKSVHIRGYSGSYFPAFGLNTERYGVSFQIQSECWIIQTRKTPNTDTFYAVNDKLVNARQSMLDWVLNTSLYEAIFLSKEVWFYHIKNDCCTDANTRVGLIKRGQTFLRVFYSSGWSSCLKNQCYKSFIHYWSEFSLPLIWVQRL